MAKQENPSIFDDRSAIGSSDELDKYGVWVKSAPQDLAGTGTGSPDHDATGKTRQFSDFDTEEPGESRDFLRDTETSGGRREEEAVAEADLSRDFSLDFEETFDENFAAEESRSAVFTEISGFAAGDETREDEILYGDFSVESAEDGGPEEEGGFPRANAFGGRTAFTMEAFEELVDAGLPGEAAPDAAGISKEIFPEDDTPPIVRLEEILEENRAAEAEIEESVFEEEPAFEDDAAFEDKADNAFDELEESDFPETGTGTGQSGGEFTFDGTSLDDFFMDDGFPLPDGELEGEDPIMRESMAEYPSQSGLSNQLLLKIAGELSSIKGELTSLKEELSSVQIRVADRKNAEPADGARTPENVPGGDFFDAESGKEDEETIALNPVEMENILNGAEFMAEEGSPEIPEPELEETLEREIAAVEKTELDLEEELFLPETEPEKEEGGPDFQPDEIPAGNGPSEDALPEAETPPEESEAASFLVPPEFPDEPAFQGEAEFPDEPETIEEISLDFPLDDPDDANPVSLPESNEYEEIIPEALTPENITTAEEDQAILEEHFSAENAPDMAAEEDLNDDISSDLNAGLEMDTVLSEPILEDFFAGPLPEGEETAESGVLFEEMDLPEEETPLSPEEGAVPLEEDELSLPDLVLDTVTLDEASFDETIPGPDDPFPEGAPPEAVSSGQETPEAGRDAGQKEFSRVPEKIKKELRTVLSYMDQLLESLPDEKIEEFARSEHFDTYKKLFEELGLA